jgi:hypothetical protein
MQQMQSDTCIALLQKNPRKNRSVLKTNFVKLITFLQAIYYAVYRVCVTSSMIHQYENMK